ncbi:hypothetical protein EVAR_11718_1 [Eumeta japonica]|uniref:Uncharacterized protein n=1 Tax=Eumeta variegata TaxID=151549 RepID=A0A4C1U4Q1_EUMVA|nr:hypothetical protein EVAR_11718_1 [Eumeta japonica]
MGRPIAPRGPAPRFNISTRRRERRSDFCAIVSDTFSDNWLKASLSNEEVSTLESTSELSSEIFSRSSQTTRPVFRGARLAIVRRCRHRFADDGRQRPSTLTGPAWRAYGQRPSMGNKTMAEKSASEFGRTVAPRPEEQAKNKVTCGGQRHRLDCSEKLAAANATREVGFLDDGGRTAIESHL